MLKKRLLALLLAAVLVLSAAPLAFAAGAPVLRVSTVSDGLAVSLSGTGGSCGGLQMSMRLNSGADVTFNFDSALFTAPGTYCTYVQQGSTLTVYMVSKTAMDPGGILPIGTLPAGSSIASVTELKLVDLNGMESTPYENISVQQSGSSGGSGSGSSGSSGTRHEIGGLGRVSNGVLQANVTNAPAGTAVTLTAVPDPGFVLTSLTIRDALGANIPVSKLSDGRYRFTMPSTAITLKAVFSPAQFPFLDVPAGKWYREAVDYVYQNGMMNGVSESAFDPNGTTTRAQIVTILHRLESEPAADNGGVPLTDIPAGKWYTVAVRWAASTGIVDGYGDGRFGPNDQITREQLAVILYRYCKFKGRDLTAVGDLSVFQDAGKVSSWAKDAMAWANGSGLITGKSETTLDPKGSATRAEAATVLMRFHSSLTKS